MRNAPSLHPSQWLTFRLGRVSWRVDRRAPRLILLLGGALLLVMVVSMAYGEYPVSPPDVLRAVVGVETSDPNHATVVRSFRLPRILVALLVGAALALSGAILQGITRNPLADPGILGINSGAGVVAVWYFAESAFPSVALLPWLAFIGAISTAFLIYLLAWRNGISPMRLILIGVGIGALGGAFISMRVIYGDIDNTQRAMIWMAGSVYNSDWAEVRVMTLWMAVLVPLTLLSARALNVLHLEDAFAQGFGMRIELQRAALILLSAALAAISVSMAGAIGFVGFVAPHIARRLVGPSHEGLLVTTACVGGLLLVLSDLLARWVIAPLELPVGVVTAILGAPYFGYLFFRRRKPAL